MEKMTEHEKLQYIYCTLEDVQNCIEFAKLSEPTKLLSHLDEDMINKSLAMVEGFGEVVPPDYCDGSGNYFRHKDDAQNWAYQQREWHGRVTKIKKLADPLGARWVVKVKE